MKSLEQMKIDERAGRIASPKMCAKHHIAFYHVCYLCEEDKNTVMIPAAELEAKNIALEKIKKKMEDNDETYWTHNGVRYENDLYVEICAALKGGA